MASREIMLNNFLFLPCREGSSSGGGVKDTKQATRHASIYPAPTEDTGIGYGIVGMHHSGTQAGSTRFRTVGCQASTWAVWRLGWGSGEG
jgi:hypothetical protein